MNSHSLLESVKRSVSEVKSKVELAKAHSRDVVETGASALIGAKDVVVDGGREAAQVASRTKQEFVRKVKEGIAQVGDKLSRITTPTRKEEAIARKMEVRAKKKLKRAAAMSQESAAVNT